MNDAERNHGSHVPASWRGTFVAFVHDLAHMFGWVPFVTGVVALELGAIWLVSLTDAKGTAGGYIVSLTLTGFVVILAFEWWIDWRSHHPSVRAPAFATPATRSRSRQRVRQNHSGQPFEFARLVQKTIDSLPESYRSGMSNVDIVIEDEPPPGPSLFGLYQGIPLTSNNRGRWYSLALPDKISIYRGPIERYCGHNHKLLEQEVRRTVLHEIAHHYGISDERLVEIGRY